MSNETTDITTVQPRRLNTEVVIQRDEFRTRITRQLLEWVSERTGITYIKIDGGGVYKEEETFECECCTDRHHEDDSCAVLTSSVTNLRRSVEQQWCVSCRDDSAFHCRNNNSYYSSNSFTQVECDGYTYCLERTDDLYYWESDDSYHWEPERESEDDNYNDGGDGVAGYHVLRRPWEQRNATRPAPNSIGVELETYAKDARSHALTAMNLGLLAERDGSLDCVYGVEIIGPPMLMAEYSAASSPWLKLFNSSTFSAWNAGTEYGMHVNLNRYGMNKLHQSKLIKFVHDNKLFCEQVAGRREVHWARYTPKRIGSVLRFEDNKYEAAALRDGRIEVRIFRATRKWESFMKNIEFCDAVRAYAAYRPICDMNLPDFLDWTRNQPGRWPHFCAWVDARVARKKENRREKQLQKQQVQKQPSPSSLMVDAIHMATEVPF